MGQSYPPPDTRRSCISRQDVHPGMFQQHFSSKAFDEQVQPQAQISIFRGEVKERFVIAVAQLVNVHDSPILIADLIERQINDNYNYIFPRRTSNVSIQRVPQLLGILTRAYRLIFSVRQHFANNHIVALLSFRQFVTFSLWGLGHLSHGTSTSSRLTNFLMEVKFQKSRRQWLP